MATDATFVTNVNLSNNELRNAKAQVLAADPSGVEGKFIYNSTDKQLKFYNGTAWVSGGAAVANLTGQASAFGQSASNGSASTAARSDHYHALPAHNAAAHSSLKLSDLAAPSANLAMGGYKLTGLAAGSANGDSVRYEQVIGQFLPIGGGTLTGPLSIAGTNGGGTFTLTGPNGSAASTDIVDIAPSVNNNAGFKITIGDESQTEAVKMTAYTHTGALAGAIEFWAAGPIEFTKNLFLGANKITGMADGVAATDAVTKQQLDTKANTSHSHAISDVTSLQTTLDAKANTSHSHAISDVTSLQTTLDAKAPLASPALTGTPTAPTASAGTNTTQIATTAFVQAAVSASAAGLDVKQSVRVATTANITLSGTQTIDTVSVVAGNRVLVKDQTTPSQNGIYVVAAGAWTRATDFDSTAEVTTGAFTFVEEGSANKNTGWVLSTTGTITVGTTGIVFVKFSASSLSEGDGITILGDTISVNYAEGLTTALGVLRADLGYFNTYYAQKYSTDLVDGIWSSTYYLVTHNLGTRDIQVSVREVAGSYGLVNVAVEAFSTTQCKVYFATKPTSGTYRVTVMG